MKLTGADRISTLEKTPSPPRPCAIGPSWLIPIFITLITFGYTLIHKGHSTISGNELSRPRILFTVTSAATLSGFAETRSLKEYAPLGQDVVIGLTIIGTLFALIVGGTAVARIARLEISDKKIWIWSIAATLFSALEQLHPIRDL